jgi:glycosyltransferase involved in cell wall biosynthesis
MSIQLTIIVPLFNEQEALAPLKLALDEYLKTTPVKSSVLFIDDGSTDKSLELIEFICESDLNYNFLSFKKNKGLSTAIKAGIDHITTPYLGYIDADLQTNPKDFLLFFSHLNSCNMVNGIRANRNDKFFKRISSQIANRFRRLIIHDNIQDTCCPLKIIETQLAKRIHFFRGMHRFLPALVQLLGGKF